MEILNTIQKELKAPKSQYNKFGGYNYRSCEDILEAVKPFLGGATLVINDEIINLGDRYYVKATVILSDNGEEAYASAYAREPLSRKGMDESQLTGAASSYARKYALNGLFCIDDTKDADVTNKHNNNAEVKTDSPYNEPKEEYDQGEILDQAFLDFEMANHQWLLDNKSKEFDLTLFTAAVLKHFGSLPTLMSSIPKVIKAIKPEDVMVEKGESNG